MNDSYFPPPASEGGWRKNVAPGFVRSLGLDPDRLEAFGQYNLSVPDGDWRPWCEHKGILVIKDGWLAGEWYAGEGSDTFLQYLASNGKAVAMACMGIVVDDSRRGDIPFEIGLESRVYDPRWLPEGFPLSDPRKSQITFHQLFQHASGLCPEAEEGGRYENDKNYTRWVLGHDPKYRETAALYYEPGHPEQYTRETRHHLDTYSSIGLQHVGLVLPHLTGMQAHEFLQKRLLEPLGFGAIGYFEPVKAWSAGSENEHIEWHTDGGLRMAPRDYARFAYFLLHDGRWRDRQIVSASWIQRFRTSTAYPNIMSNRDGLFGAAYPRDMFRISGSGLSWAFMIPSLDLVAVRTGRSDNRLRATVESTFLEMLFDAVL
jgi:hypothetical protein